MGSIWGMIHILDEAILLICNKIQSRVLGRSVRRSQTPVKRIETTVQLVGSILPSKELFGTNESPYHARSRPHPCTRLEPRQLTNDMDALYTDLDRLDHLSLMSRKAWSDARN